MRISLLAGELQAMRLSSSGALLSGAASSRLFQLITSVLTLLFTTSSIVSSFQSRNVFVDSETSSLHWKSELRNVWGQSTRISTLWRCFSCPHPPHQLVSGQTPLLLGLRAKTLHCLIHCELSPLLFTTSSVGSCPHIPLHHLIHCELSQLPFTTSSIVSCHHSLLHHLVYCELSNLLFTTSSIASCQNALNLPSRAL